jgi:hypothetical protein
MLDLPQPCSKPNLGASTLSGQVATGAEIKSDYELFSSPANTYCKAGPYSMGQGRLRIGISLLAGNGRAAITPRSQSQPWHHGAVGTPDWTGTPLKPLLERIGLAVLGDLLDLALEEISLDVGAVDALGLSGHAHDLAELVRRSTQLEWAIPPQISGEMKPDGHYAHAALTPARPPTCRP